VANGLYTRTPLCTSHIKAFHLFPSLINYYLSKFALLNTFYQIRAIIHKHVWLAAAEFCPWRQAAELRAERRGDKNQQHSNATHM
jgi:hypothetical protein